MCLLLSRVHLMFTVDLVEFRHMSATAATSVFTLLNLTLVDVDSCCPDEWSRAPRLAATVTPDSLQTLLQMASQSRHKIVQPTIHISQQRRDGGRVFPPEGQCCAPLWSSLKTAFMTSSRATLAAAVCRWMPSNIKSTTVLHGWLTMFWVHARHAIHN